MVNSNKPTSQIEWIAAAIILVVGGFGAAIFLGRSKGNDTSEQVPYEAITKCQERVRAEVAHPSTLIFSAFNQSSDNGAPGGGYRVGLGFEAKNSFNLTLKFKALCKFKPGSLVIDDFVTLEDGN
ncbi:hypothetical protein [Xanthomonas nasturtii]|uniref:Uncharacterized protein n=1 Tax=Xanthomonas nasturtii TaxID=1843581 RepID=A0ABT0LMC0_9XANT|nr:hypothetical protein [Xanthomonas nasturtii]MCL1550480.1 hypothetical protein [Xanthomonas nasturtii]MCL1554730.1 hypothetical protein [Xanthomonas nasturtii]